MNAPDDALAGDDGDDAAPPQAPVNRFYCAGYNVKDDEGNRYCSYRAPKRWLGRCPQCFRPYDCLPVRQRMEFDAAKSFAAMGLAAQKVKRISTGSREFDLVLGGGMVPGSCIVLSGDAGSGKSTFLLAVADAVGRGPRSQVLYTSGEQSSKDLGLYISRLGLTSEFVQGEGNAVNAGDIVDMVRARRPALLIMDSLQTVTLDDVGGSEGSASQLKEVTQTITGLCKEENVTAILVCQVSKDGTTMAGPKTIDHLVDVVTHLDFDVDRDADPRFYGVRVLRSGKNRYAADSAPQRHYLELSPLGLPSTLTPETMRLILERDGADDGPRPSVGGPSRIPRRYMKQGGEQD